MKIYLVRHGESVGNVTRTHQPEESPLSVEGQRQADKLASRFEGVQVDAIIASPLMRTKQTAEKIAHTVGLPIEFDARLKELKRPSIVVGRSPLDADIAAIWEKIDIHKEDPQFHYADEENFFDMRSRLSDFLQSLPVRRDTSMILVSHGYAIRTLVGLMIFGNDFSAQQFFQMIDHVSTANTGVTVCDYTPDFGWRVITLNDAAHLLD